MRKHFAIICVTMVILLASTACGIQSEDIPEESAKEQMQTEYSVINSAETEWFTERDRNPIYDSNEAYHIDLSEKQSDTEAAIFTDNVIEIVEEGVYILSGTYDGTVTVNAKDKKVQLVLQNAEIRSEEVPAILVSDADKVFLTLEGENTLQMLSCATESNRREDAALFAECTLSIGGAGKLTVNSSYNGITSKDHLKICGGQLEINAENHGIEGKDSVRVCDGTIKIAAGQDGIHSDKDNEGSVIVEGGSISIAADDDGIHASKSVMIYDGKIQVENSYEGIEAETIQINGGCINIYANDDGINASGGKNPRNPDLSKQTGLPTVEINGGYVYVNAEGDGVDSNGYITVNGGEVYVDGPVNSANGALDCEDRMGKAVINGGKVVALGAKAMAVGFSEGIQGSAIIDIGKIPGDLELKDKDGNTLLSYPQEKPYECVVISCPEMVNNGTYTLMVGEKEIVFQLDGLRYTSESIEMGPFSGVHGGGRLQNDHNDFIGGPPPKDGKFEKHIPPEPWKS